MGQKLSGNSLTSQSAKQTCRFPRGRQCQMLGINKTCTLGHIPTQLTHTTICTQTFPHSNIRDSTLVTEPQATQKPQTLELRLPQIGTTWKHTPTVRDLTTKGHTSEVWNSRHQTQETDSETALTPRTKVTTLEIAHSLLRIWAQKCLHPEHRHSNTSESSSEGYRPSDLKRETYKYSAQTPPWHWEILHTK